jgi:hypothetical protein
MSTCRSSPSVNDRCALPACGSNAMRACRYRLRARLQQSIDSGTKTHHTPRARTSIAILSSSFKAMPNSYAVTLAMRLMLLPFLPSHIDLFLGRPFFLHSSDDLATTTDAFDFDQELSDSTCFFSSQCSLL